jgi:hypothetical protein
MGTPKRDCNLVINSATHITVVDKIPQTVFTIVGKPGTENPPLRAQIAGYRCS